MKEKTAKKIVVASIIAIALGVIIGALILHKPQTECSRYGNEAIRILEKYKSFDIDAKEASKRLDDLRDTVYKKKSKATTEHEAHNLTMLWLALINIHRKIYYEGSATGYEVDEAITEIKRHL